MITTCQVNERTKCIRPWLGQSCHVGWNAVQQGEQQRLPTAEMTMLRWTLDLRADRLCNLLSVCGTCRRCHVTRIHHWILSAGWIIRFPGLGQVLTENVMWTLIHAPRLYDETVQVMMSPSWKSWWSIDWGMDHVRWRDVGHVGQRVQEIVVMGQSPWGRPRRRKFWNTEGRHEGCSP